MNCPYSVGWFPLIKLAKKLKGLVVGLYCLLVIAFPLIKLAKKLKGDIPPRVANIRRIFVSIN
jgi:hypothetical protein